MFPVWYCKICKYSFFIEHLWWLLLTVLPKYSTVSWGVFTLILCLYMLLILIKNLKCCTNNSFLSWQNHFLLAWIDWSSAFDFRIYFGKTLVSFNFDQNLHKASLIKKLTDINWCLTDPANRCLTDINWYYISYSTYPVLVILNQ